jgi:hypothetical protein
VATYHYGFPSLIGAGPYDRRGQATAIAAPAPETVFSGGGGQLTGALPSVGTVTLADSLTYGGAADLSVTGDLTIRAGLSQRPLVRLASGAPWVIVGDSPDACLTLDGLFVSGQDIVLRGQFAGVTLGCCTLDPGDSAHGDPLAPASPPATVFLTSADGRALRPTALWIEAEIGVLRADRCVLGPVRTRGAGRVESATISNSVIQAIRTAGLGPLAPEQVKDPPRLLRQLQLGLDPVSAMLRALDPQIEALLGTAASPPLDAPSPPAGDLGQLIDRLNLLLSGPSLYSAAAFADVPLSAETRRLLGQSPPMQPAPEANRLLLEDAYPLELADAALAFGDGELDLERCTVLGRLVAHRLQASECILHELAAVDDTQHGCVRFSAWAQGSKLPGKYESVTVPQFAPLFVSTDFGHPAYAQLLPTVDQQRLPPPKPGLTPQNTISAGAEDGSEMGAYARDKNPIRAKALLLKLAEYMPAGLAPVIVNVT